jgi:hypothetical protein
MASWVFVMPADSLIYHFKIKKKGASGPSLASTPSSMKLWANGGSECRHIIAIEKLSLHDFPGLSLHDFPGLFVLEHTSILSSYSPRKTLTSWFFLGGGHYPPRLWDCDASDCRDFFWTINHFRILTLWFSEDRHSPPPGIMYLRPPGIMKGLKVLANMAAIEATYISPSPRQCHIYLYKK